MVREPPSGGFLLGKINVAPQQSLMYHYPQLRKIIHLIVEDFMHMKRRIWKNLEGRVHGINPILAISGIDSLDEGMKALNEMIRDGLVEKMHYGNRDLAGHYTVRRRARVEPTFGLKLVVNNA